MKTKRIVSIFLGIAVLFGCMIIQARAREMEEDGYDWQFLSPKEKLIQVVNQEVYCPRPSGCVMGECFVTESYDYTAGNCPGQACKDLVNEINAANATNTKNLTTLKGEGLLKSWTKYDLILYTISNWFFSPDYGSWEWHELKEAYSDADKCTNDSSSNKCLANNVGLWAGSCEGGAGGFFKCCCHNQTNKPISSVPDPAADNHPPLEGICPAEGHWLWKNGAGFSPDECAEICNPPGKPNFCDLEQNCKYGTLSELGINQAVASNRIALKTLRDDVNKEECSYLCKELYVCRDSKLVSVEKGEYTSLNQCVAWERLKCFGPNDPEYAACPLGTVIETEPVTGNKYWYFSEETGVCKESPFFEDRDECEESLETACYSTKDECEGGLHLYYTCNPGYGCFNGKYPSIEVCEKINDGKSCSESCPANCTVSIGGSTCSSLPPDQGTGLDLTLSANQCITEGNSTNITWSTSSQSASCGNGEILEHRTVSCKSLCGDWTVVGSIGSDIVSPDYRSEYGLQCTLDYECCTYKEEKVGEPRCDSEGKNCVQETEIVRHCYDHSTVSKSKKTEVRVVSKPTIDDFKPTPPEILYTSEKIKERKHSTLSWSSSARPTGSVTQISCELDDTTYFGSNNKTEVYPQKTTNYTLVCTNKDAVQIPDPECYLESDPETRTVRVFGAGIEETKPQPQSYLEGFKKLVGEIREAIE